MRFRSMSLVFVFLLCLIAPNVVLAQTPTASQAPMSSSTSDGRVGVAVSASSLGITGDVAVKVNDHANLRAGLSHFSLSRDFDVDGTIYAANVKLHSIHVFLDWFPTGGGFHISPGLVFGNDNKASFNASIQGGTTIDIGDVEYASSSTDPIKANGSVSVKSTGMALTMGWGNLVPRTRRFSVPFEFGVVFQGAPTGVLGYTGSACNSNGTNCRDVSTDATIQAEITKQNTELNDGLNKWYTKYYPILSLGFGIRF